MKKTTLILITLFSIGLIQAQTKVQTPDQVYDKFLDFNDARAHNNLGKTLTLGQQILSNVDKLPAKTRIPHPVIDLAPAYAHFFQLTDGNFHRFLHYQPV